MLETIIIEPPTPAQYAMIWCHGLGADGHDFVPLGDVLQGKLSVPMRFIFPHAPLRPVTLNNGYVMRAWYDILGLSLQTREDQEGLSEAAQQLDLLIQQQAQLGIPYKNIFLGGFSQGGASILYTGLRYPHTLGGFIALSAYLPLFKLIREEKHAANQHTPIFWGHGTEDTIVPAQWADISIRALNAAGHSAKLHHYPIAHQVCEEEIEDLVKWLRPLVGNGVAA